MIPRACPFCGEHKVRRVLHPGLIDHLLSPFAEAWRCRACRRRFRRFRWGPPDTAANGSESPVPLEPAARRCRRLEVRITVRRGYPDVSGAPAGHPRLVQDQVPS